MGRPKKFPTTVVRIRKEDVRKLREHAKCLNMSLTDYINYRLRK